MNAEQALLQAYAEWRRLAEAEGKAVRRQDWKFLLECQSALKKIQPLIDQLSNEARAEWKRSEMDSSTKEKQLQRTVAELIELGNRNQLLLKIARQSAQVKREQVEHAGRNLKRLQLAYASARPTAWSSFS